MADTSSETKLLLRRQITVKAVVTPLWKEDAQKQLQLQINQIDGQLQQVELQAQQIINELEKQATPDAAELLSTRIQEVRAQVNTRQGELLQQKNGVLQQLDQVQRLEMEEEVNQGQMDNFFYAKQGDHLIQKMQVEILLRDGVIEQIRGTL